MNSVRVISGGQSLLGELISLFSWADDIDMVFAWASSLGGTGAHWAAINLAKVRRAVIGIHFNQTEPAALRALMKTNVLRVFAGTDGVFHPKIIIGVKDDTYRVILGSSNFTSGGYGSNVEVNAVIEGMVSDQPIAEVIAFVNTQWKHRKTFKPTEKWLEKYEVAWKHRPKPPKTPAPPGPGPLMMQNDLEVDFSAYFDLVLSQEHRLLADGDTIRVFDDERSSYLQEAEACQSAFISHPKFAAMPVEHRRLVSGWGQETSGYFGRMTGAGYFKQAVLDTPLAIGKHLDRMPLVGNVPMALASEVLNGLLSVQGVALGTATRLLTVKRPDLFLTVNDANRPRLRQIFGSASTTIGRYLTLHKDIWAMPWASSPKPVGADERRVWAARVALLDALLYEPKV